MWRLISKSWRSRLSLVGTLRMLVLTVSAILWPQLGSAQTTVLWQEDWEGNWFQDWFVEAGTWEVGEPTSGPNSAFASLKCAATVLDGDYDEPVDSRLIRFTSFVVPSATENPRLRFWHWYSIFLIC